MVFVAQVEVTRVHPHQLRRDQHALQKAVRVALQIHPVFERAGLPFVDVDGHKARPGLVTHDAPFAPRRKPRPAQAPQARVLHRLDQAFRIDLTRRQRSGKPVAALGTVGGVTGEGGHHVSGLRRWRDTFLGPVRRYEIYSCLRM